MSTSFKVLPGSDFLPSFGELIELSTIRLQQVLQELGINERPSISVVLRSKELVKRVDPQSPTKWHDDWYAWFSVAHIQGGTDMQLMRVREGTQEMWEEEAKYNQRISERKELILSCLNVGYYWVISRTMGQSATINLTYGLIASSMAELTKGFIYTYDCAWEPERFPATADEFDSWYFRPALAIDPSYKDFAERCIEAIPDELAV